MGYSVAFLGDIAFEPGGYTQWQKAALAGGWTVGDLCDEMSGDVLVFDRSPERVRLRMLVSHDDAFYLNHREAAEEAFAVAAAHGGVGELLILGWDDAPDVGRRVTLAPEGKSAVAELRAAERKRARNTDAYRELEELLRKQLGRRRAVAMPAQKARAAPSEGSIQAAIAEARLDPPERDHARSSPVTRELAASKDPNAAAVMLETLEHLLGGPVWKIDVTPKDRLLALVLVEALREKKVHDPRIDRLWTDSPYEELRNEEEALRLKDATVTARLASHFGEEGRPPTRDLARAVIASDPKRAVKFARALLDGDPRKRAQLEWLGCFVGALSFPEANRADWEEFVREVVTSAPRGKTKKDQYDEYRASAVRLMASWKMPGAAAQIVEWFDHVGVMTASKLLIALGDRAVVPALKARLARTKGKGDREWITHAISGLR